MQASCSLSPYLQAPKLSTCPTDEASPVSDETKSEPIQETTSLLNDGHPADLYSVSNIVSSSIKDQQFRQTLESLESLPASLPKQRPVSSLVPLALLNELIAQPNKWVHINCDTSDGRKYSAVFYPEKQLIRISESCKPPLKYRSDLVDIWLNASSEEENIDQVSGNNNARIFRLVEAGVLKDTVLVKLGISSLEIDQAKQVEEQVERQNEIYSKQLLQDSVTSLPPIHQYAANSTLVVPTGSVYIFSPMQCPDMGLYTEGAGPCQILIAIAKDSDGTLQQIALGHIDCNVGQTALINLFTRLATGVNRGCLEVSLIGGIQRTALRVITAAHMVEADIKFAAANFSQQRSDAVAVDMEGKIYYGPTTRFRDQPSPYVADRSCFLRVEEQLNIEQVALISTP